MRASPKVCRVDDGRWMWWCEACKTHHWADSRWSFDGNMEMPTFSPSFLIVDCPNPGDRCHSFVGAGRVRYLDDCTHALKGQTLLLKEI